MATSYIALIAIVGVALALLSWSVMMLSSPEFRAGFWKRASFGALLLTLVSPAILSDWPSTLSFARSAEHHQVYLAGLAAGVLAAVTATVLEPAWRITRARVLVSLIAVFVAFVALLAYTFQVERLRDLLMNGPTLGGLAFCFGLVALIWRVATGRERVHEDGYSRLLKRNL